jgi:dienelactone hydrolase
MAISKDPVTFTIGGAVYEGMHVRDRRAGGDQPCILILHHWAGRKDDMIAFGEDIANWGYAAFACDLYGQGRFGGTPDENRALMGPLVGDRPLLEMRMLANLEAAAGLPGVDRERMAAIGFCFGGLCALDLARANAPLKAVASMHGILKPRPGDGSDAIRPKVTIFHGWDDPMAPPEDVTAIGAELTARQADWQLHAYGNTMHAFTNEQASDPDHGLQYQPAAARRAWASFRDFLEEVL